MKTSQALTINRNDTVRKIIRYLGNDPIIVIPESIEEIGEGAFDKCSNLKEVYCKAVIPPKVKWKSGSNHDLFKNNSPGRKIYVPYESVDAYKKASLWRIYAKDIVGFDFEEDIKDFV